MIAIMRNLKSVRLTELQLQTELPVTAAAWDSASDSGIYAFGPTKDSGIIELRRRRQDAEIKDLVKIEDFESIASWDAPCPLPDLACDRILSLQHFADNFSTVLILEGGDIVVVREDPQLGEDKIEIVGSVDAGITAAAWSPDEELLAISTRANTFLYMTRDFESIAEIVFDADDLKLSRHVSVGWGKKETQFQGKRAKALRDPTIPEKVDEGKISPNDDHRTTITWRGDGQYVAVNSFQSDVRRVIRVYSREGVLDSVSEPVDGLEGALSWRPAGNLIAGIQRLDDRVDVVFFERNGLRHGEFSLRLSEKERATWASKIYLDWNIDSTVLAVRFLDRIQLWTMGNYHYYLKQEIPLFGEVTQPHFFRWHQEKPLRFIAASADTILDADWVFDICHGSTTIPHDVGAVAVIDGTTLKLTPLRLTGVPPPMSHCELSMDTNIVDACFNCSGSRIGVLTRTNFSVFSWSINARPIPEPLLESSYPLSEASFCRPRQITFFQDKEVIILNHPNPHQAQIERTKLETRSTEMIYCAAANVHLYSVFPSLAHDILWVASRPNLRGPTIYSIIAAGDSSDLQPVTWNDSPTVETLWAEATQTHNEFDVLVTLSRTGALYANKRLLAKNCTSFMLTPAHIVYTTSQHLLKFVHIVRPEDMEIPDDTPETDERCRNIERGGRLVTVTPSNFAVTLQMPRGNLETIYPRALVLAGVRSFIDRKDYRSAYSACRSQIVDVNILHDYAPQQFMENIPLFIRQLGIVDYIDDFLSHLKEEDVSQTLYKDTLKASPVEAQEAPAATMASSASSKVNRICDAFISTLRSMTDTNLQNLITAHVCKSPPDLEEGLRLVARLRVSHLEQAEEAIEHMCFLTDANRLYDHALGMYDLELTLLVAQQAQRDPREYLPFLRKLQNLPEPRRMFEIDNHLSRNAKAIKHLHALNAHDELRSYAVKYALYLDALDLYKYQPHHFDTINQLYADYLLTQSRPREAAIIYESLRLYESAYKAYQLAHLWRESLLCALLVPLEESHMQAFALDMANTLVEENKDYISAAYIHAEHLKDITTAARLFCRGSRFADASRLLALNGQGDLIPEIVESGMVETMGTMTEFLADCKSQLEAQVPRIRELRDKRATDPLAFFGGDPSMGDGDFAGGDVPDNVSLAPTDASTAAGHSLFTRYTDGTNSSRYTSRTKRREERKRARGKRGTVYEEEYLVNSMRRLFERVNSTLNDLETLVETLFRHGMRERAMAVEKAVEDVLHLCKDGVAEVFPSSPTEKKGDDLDTGVESQEQEAAVHGGDAVLLESIMSRDTAVAPVVKEFRQLSLCR